MGKDHTLPFQSTIQYMSFVYLNHLYCSKSTLELPLGHLIHEQLKDCPSNTYKADFVGHLSPLNLMQIVNTRLLLGNNK